MAKTTYKGFKIADLPQMNNEDLSELLNEDGELRHKWVPLDMAAKRLSITTPSLRSRISKGSMVAKKIYTLALVDITSAPPKEEINSGNTNKVEESEENVETSVSENEVDELLE